MKNQIGSSNPRLFLSKSHNLALAFLIPLVAGQLACQSESRSLAPAPVIYQSESRQASSVQIDVNAQVDILFVIDDSGSMRSHQTNLAQNIDRFAEGFAKNNLIDFHIGVLSIYDSRRYGAYDVVTNRRIQEGVVHDLDRNGNRLFDPAGNLRMLKAPEGKSELLKNQAPNFIAKADGFVEILRQTLKIGVREYQKNNTEKKEAQGPEYEEVFTPVMAALTDPVASTANKGFLRKNAHLVVILVTDANDASQITASQMANFLTALKGKGNYTVFGILHTADSVKICDRDPSGPPRKIQALIRMTGGQEFNLCTNYADQLSTVGQMVEDKTIREVRIPLGRKIQTEDDPRILFDQPDKARTQVHFGGFLVPAGQPQEDRTTWRLDSQDGEDVIIVHNAAHLPENKGASLSVQFVPVNPLRATSTCVGCRVEHSR